MKNHNGNYPHSEYYTFPYEDTRCQVGEARGKFPLYTYLGLCNLGNTYYFNGALQCLGHTMGLTNYCFEKVQFPKKGIGEAYKRVIQNIWGGGNGPFSPKELVSKVQTKYKSAVIVSIRQTLYYLFF